ncbi:hypothetical protein RF11_04143 [Thelohanellus kitauei]|uniref:Uncharacterized protein n=1 Tax=Thelohanellus kitauei TaxID=669202 RepID=A0A0C2N2W1_THEKT|nr:hypothetical protein RF11_04143 [Thelohanellus kitauei]
MSYSYLIIEEKAVSLSPSLLIVMSAPLNEHNEVRLGRLAVDLKQHISGELKDKHKCRARKLDSQNVERKSTTTEYDAGFLQFTYHCTSRIVSQPNNEGGKRNECRDKYFKFHPNQRP